MVWSATEPPHLKTIQRDDGMINDIIQKAKEFFHVVILPEMLAQYYTRVDLLQPPRKKKARVKKPISKKAKVKKPTSKKAGQEKNLISKDESL